MIHIETKHYLNNAKTKVVKTEKTWKVFGIRIKRKTFNYPEKKEFDVLII